MQDRNEGDKNEGYEESEYHFSDDDVSYDAEHQDEVSTSEAPVKERFSADRTKMKRAGIIVGVFIALVFVVYKFVSPTSTVPPTDIMDQAVVASVPAAASTVTQQAAAQTSQPIVPISSPAPVQAAPSQAGMVPPVQTAGTAAPAGLPAPGSPMQAGPQQPTQQIAQSASLPPPIAPGDSIQSTAMPAVSAQPPIAMPDVIPMQSAVPTAPSQALSSAVATPQVSQGINGRISNLDAQSSQLMQQVETAYAQKLNEFAGQNKALQTQVQTLDNRVAGLEAELKQLLQTLTQQSQPQPRNAQPSAGAATDLSYQQAPAPTDTAPAYESNYSVQAIIPGRAWLRSQNGETITVAEGDVIRDLGRITKINPYDGIVEINTGNKVVSLSYGTTG